MEPSKSKRQKEESKKDVPQLGLLGNELVHQLGALVIPQDDHLDAPTAQVVLAAQKVLVLGNHDARDAVQQTRSRAHVAGRQGRVHGGALVGFGRQAACVVQG